MHSVQRLTIIVALSMGLSISASFSDTTVPVGTEQRYLTANHLPIRVKAIGPVQADTDLQIICLFKHNPSGDTMIGALDDLDQKLGRSISALRNRGEFAGDELETILIKPPVGSIHPKQLLIIGLGDESTLSVTKMGRIGTVAFRAAQQVGATHIAFAPTIRDQGDSVIPTGEVAASVIRNFILAYNTQQRMQREGLSKPYQIQDFIFEAGPQFYNEVNAKVAKVIPTAALELTERSTKPYLLAK